MTLTLKKRAGAAALITVLGVATVVVAAFLTLTTLATDQLVQVSDTADSDQAYYAAEAGLNDGLYKLTTSPGPQTYSLTINGAVANIDIAVDPTDLLGKRRLITSTATYQEKQRTVAIAATTNAMAMSSQYAVMSGDGGVQLDNNCIVQGNLYANGPVVGKNSGAVIIEGHVWSAGVNSLIKDLTVGRPADQKDAHAQNFDNVVITGTRYTETPPVKPYPITTDQINVMKDLADNTITNQNVTINSDTTLDAQKIEGNLLIESGILTITGPIWVTGTLDTKPGVIIHLAPSLGEASSAIIFDQAVEIKNNAVLEGSGNPKSFLLIASLKADISSPVIFGANNSESVIYFAPDGLIKVNQNAILNNTTGNMIHLQENSMIKFNPNLSGFYIPGGDPQPVGTVGHSWKEL